ncbi:MAG: endonuclease III domain-containing protein [Elusimicrobiales bacterium]
MSLKKIEKIYKILYEFYGPQGWWPICLDGRSVYRKNYFGPLSDSQRFEICVGAILTQNVSWKNVEKCIVKLKENRMLDPVKIIEEPDEKIYPLIISSGYYKQKALKLKNISRWIIHKGGDFKKIFKKNPYKIRNELLLINGIGKETADSILLYAGYLPFFVIDAYTKRIFERIFNRICYEYDELQNLFQESLPLDHRIYNEYHALIVEISKNICLKNDPQCLRCPLRMLCSYGRDYGGRNNRKTS